MVREVYFTKEQLDLATPSRRDGIDEKQEAKYRRRYCDLLNYSASKLKLGNLPKVTAMVFCHRFYTQNSHADPDNEIHVIAAAALFLSTKVEEVPRALEDVVNVFFRARNVGTLSGEQMDAQLADPAVMTREVTAINRAERRILLTIDFEVNIMHPYGPLSEIFGKLPGVFDRPLADYAWGKCTERRAQKYGHGQRTDRPENVVFRTLLCLQYPPRDIAAAIMWYAARSKRAEFSRGADNATVLSFLKSWGFSGDLKTLHVITTQLLEAKAPDPNAAAAAGAGGSAKPAPPGGHQQRPPPPAGGGGGAGPSGSAGGGVGARPDGGAGEEDGERPAKRARSGEGPGAGGGGE